MSKILSSLPSLYSGVIPRSSNVWSSAGSAISFRIYKSIYAYLRVRALVFYIGDAYMRLRRLGDAHSM